MNNQKTNYPPRVYTYKGQDVFLASLDDMPGVEPFDDCGTERATIGCFPVDSYNGCPVCSSCDEYHDIFNEDICFEKDEIILAECVDPFNQKKLKECWWTKRYAADDDVKRRLCTVTDDTYEWTSELTKIICRVKNFAHEGLLFKDDFEYLDLSWVNVINRYKRRYREFGKLDAYSDIKSFKKICDDLHICISDETSVALSNQNYT